MDYIFSNAAEARQRGEKLGSHTNNETFVQKRVVERCGLMPTLHLNLVSTRDTGHCMGRQNPIDV